MRLVVTLSLLVIVLLAAVLGAAQQLTETVKLNAQMWAKYRHELVHRLATDYCSKMGQGATNQCAAVQNTVFQFVDEPRDAVWDKSRYFVCLFFFVF